MKIKRTIYTVFFLLLTQLAYSQTTVNHWEGVVLAENEWRYRPGNTEPPQGWMNSGFDDSFWGQGEGGIGYGDGDDNTIINQATSVYLRKEFEITDISKIAELILLADYDDAFVAYINGQEIARANIGQTGQIPAFNEPAVNNHEAQLYQGGITEEFPLSIEFFLSLVQNGTNTLAIQVHNIEISSSDLSAIFFLALGINDESFDYQPLPSWFLDPFVSSNLPILIIETDDNIGIPNDPKIAAHLGIISNQAGQRNYLTDPYNAYDDQIGIEIRGSSSLMFPKKNYGFETRDIQGENNNVSLLGMPAENDWILHGPFSDKSLMRNVLSYHIGDLTGRYTPRTRWCELIINNSYRGVYVLTEKIKRDQNRVNISKLKEEDIEGDELTGGYLFKIDRNDAGIDDGWTSNYDDNVFYAYEDPGFDQLLPIQKQYIREYIMGFEDAVFFDGNASLFEQYIDLPSFVDYWIATEIFKHIDGWKLSFYMYKKKDSNGGKIHFGPLWDLNLAYGNFNFSRDPGPEGWSWAWAENTSNRPFWLIEILGVPSIADQINCRWQELRQSAYSTDALLLFLDQNKVLLTEARERNFQRWPILGSYIWPNSFVGDDYEEEYDFLTNWLQDRLEWMDNNMVGNCTISTTDILPSEAKVAVYPNPAGEEALHFNYFSNQINSAKITISNTLGQILLTAQIKSNFDNLIDISSFHSGIYYYQIQKDSKMIIDGKFLKI